MAVGHGASIKQHLSSVFKGILHAIGIEILVDIIVAVMPSPGTLGLDWPCILHPATLVDVMDQEVAERPTRQPQEGVETTDLVHQLVGWPVLGLPQRSG